MKSYRMKHLPFLLIFPFLFFGCGQQQQAVDELKTVITDKVEAKDSSVLRNTSELRNMALENQDWNTYYWSYLMEGNYHMGISSKLRNVSQFRLSLQQMEADLRNLHNYDEGWASLYYLRGRQAFLSMNYTAAVKYLAQALQYDSFDEETKSSIYVQMAKSNYGLFRCGESLEASKTARQLTTREKKLSDITGTECLTYGYMGDMESFESSYEQFRKNPEGVYVMDSIYIEAYHEAFTTQKYDEKLYAELMPEIKHLKLNYLINRLLGNKEDALEYYEQFLDVRSQNVQSQDDDFAEIANIREYSHNLEMKNASDRNRFVLLLTSLVLFVVIVLILMIAKVKKKNRQLKESNAIQTRFMQNMSHELRTPLNAILGFSQLLALPAEMFTEDERQQYSGFVMSNSQLLITLVDDVLAINDVENGNLKVTVSDCEVNQICENAISNCEARLLPGVSMTYNRTLPAQLMVKNDPNRILQVLVNFLTNACKNTEKGSIVLTCEQKGSNLLFAVTDTGCGIPADKREMIFERFTKVDEFKQGSGLGLNICKMIATCMKADIRLDADYTNGARFLFEVPANLEI